MKLYRAVVEMCSAVAAGDAWKYVDIEAAVKARNYLIGAVCNGDTSEDTLASLRSVQYVLRKVENERCVPGIMGDAYAMNNFTLLVLEVLRSTDGARWRNLGSLISSKLYDSSGIAVYELIGYCPDGDATEQALADAAMAQILDVVLDNVEDVDLLRRRAKFLYDCTYDKDDVLDADTARTFKELWPEEG